jgi:putative tricarboxylic transport membrane protein
MFIHGVRPGPLIMVEFPSFVYEVVAMVLFATTAMFILGLSMVRALVKVLLVPRQKLMPIIFTLCVVGSYAITGRVFDVGVMVVFGLIGYVLREMDYPMAPLVLGIILGDILDKNLRRALILTDGAIAPFFGSTISVILVVITAYVIVSRSPIFQRVQRAITRAILAPFRKSEAK